MKKNMFRVSALALFYLLAGCSQKQEEAPVPGMHLLDLSKYGKPFSILVPDTVQNILQVTEQPNGALDIMAGKNFAISIFEQEADLKLKKQDITDDEVNKLKQFVKEDQHGLIWESQIVEPEFHFLVNNTVNQSSFSFEDIHDPQMKTFTKDAIEKMYHSATNLRAHDTQ